MNGKVKRLVADKGFGFILGEDNQEYFFHQTAVKNTQFAALQEGDEVQFEETEGAKGLRAEDVYV